MSGGSRALRSRGLWTDLGSGNVSRLIASDCMPWVSDEWMSGGLRDGGDLPARGAAVTAAMRAERAMKAAFILVGLYGEFGFVDGRAHGWRKRK